MKIEYRSATKELLEDFIQDIRKEDQEECELSSQEDWTEYQKRFFQPDRMKNTTVLYINGKVLGVFGIENQEGCNVGWLLLTNQVDTYKIAFLRQTRKYIEEVILPQHGYFCNYVYEKNALHLYWLEWLGATFRKTPVKDFIYFHLGKEESNV